MQLAAPRAKVLRDGAVTSVKTELIVPDDVLLVASGTRISADACVIESLSLERRRIVVDG